MLSWLPPPTDLKLLEKSDRFMHVAWSPPEIFDPAYKDLITHYLVNRLSLNLIKNSFTLYDFLIKSSLFSLGIYFFNFRIHSNLFS